jgi:hypothetical protein
LGCLEPNRGSLAQRAAVAALHSKRGDDKQNQKANDDEQERHAPTPQGSIALLKREFQPVCLLRVISGR